MKFYYNPNFLAVFFLVIFSIFALEDLTRTGFYTSHDGETHTARIAQYYLGLTNGHIPPRFASTFYNGLGSPIFVYIYPIPYALGSLVHLVGFSYVDTFKILMSLGFLFSGLFAYLWLSELFKSKKAGFIGALFYMWVPYRFLLIYVRASISELLAYTFLPLLLLALTKLADKISSRWVSVSAISFAFVLLSQNLVALISIPVLGGYILINSLSYRSTKYFLFAAISLLWGSAIASFVYLPAFFERKFVRFADTIPLQYSSHFVTLKQLIRSPWDYGFDLPGTVNDHMSFQLGLAQILVLIMSLVIFYLVAKKNKVFQLKNFLNISRKENILMYVLFLLILLVSALMMIQTQTAEYLWQNIAVLHLIDLPWRLIGICTLSFAFFSAFIAKNTKNGLLFMFLIFAVIIANRNHLRINEQVFYNDLHFEKYYGTATQYGEFAPIWRGTVSPDERFNPSERTEFTHGIGNVFNMEEKPNKITFSAEVASPSSRLRINKSYFPGIIIEVDNKKLVSFEEQMVSRPGADNPQDVGVLALNLPQGSHNIKVIFGETNLRLIANYISLISLIVAVIFYVKPPHVKSKN